jgi:TolB protein
MPKLFRLAILGICLAGPVLIVPPAYATFPGTQGKIAFQSDRDGNLEIYTMNADGSGQTRLTNNGAIDEHPKWSPDGKKIAFDSNRDGNLEIYTMNADGSGQTRITNNTVFDEMPTWSPDGSKFAFDSGRDDSHSEIYTMNADGSNVVRLTNDPGYDFAASWSPDGTKIAWQTSRNSAQYDIYDMNTDGTGQTRLTNNTTNDEYPNWDPTSSLIYFDNASSGIVSIDTNGISNFSVSGSGRDFAPSPAPIPPPGGTRMFAYSETAGSDTQIWIFCDAGCGGQHFLQRTFAPGTNAYPDWQPVVRNYARPRGATPLRVSLVPAYKPCDPNRDPPPNARHGGSISSPACVPPTPESSYLTVGSPDFNGVGANSIGSVLFTVRATSPEDILITVSDTDVRCAGTSSGCSNGALSDYADDLRFEAGFRITDKGNGGVGSGTVVDLPVQFNVPCATTSSTTVGSTCSINTSVNTLFGGTAITDSRRAIWQQTDPVRVYDGGADGLASTVGDNTLFAVGGLFAP